MGSLETEDRKEN